MALNPYFNFVNKITEQDLLQDLIDESIKIYGHETYYIRRENANLDMFMGEDDLTTYSNAVPIEMYIKSSSSFAGAGDFISKFGLQIEDQCTFSLSRRRFEAELGGELVRPHEGDLIWLKMQAAPFAQCPMFEIRFVEQKEQLFQLGKLYTYELRCELMSYSHERVQTANAEVNMSATENAYTLRIPLGTGSGTYIIGEPVYQGTTFLNATATGTVSAFVANTSTLSLQNITGTFVANTIIIGITSGANYLAGTTPDIAPSVNDPISDNVRLREEGDDIIIVRGTNPRKS